MRVLVTGAAGFVGSHYVRTLLSGGYPSLGAAEVTVLDKLTPSANLANLAPVAERLRFVQGDVADASLLAELLPGHDAVVHFASETEGPGGASAPNEIGNAVLLDRCAEAEISRVVQVASIDGIADGIADASVDGIADPLQRTTRRGAATVRSPGNYGPYCPPTATFSACVTALLDGTRELPVDRRRTRGWVHVDDHCRAVQLVLERGRMGEVYPLAPTCELSDAELVERMIDVIERRRSSPPPAPPDGHDDRRIRALGYRPLVEFDEGLIATVQWYRDNESWWRPLKEKLPALDA